VRQPRGRHADETNPGMRLRRNRTRGTLFFQKRGETMHNEFTAVVERDGKWFVAFCPEIPGANGLGKTKAECLKSLAEAIDLILGRCRGFAALTCRTVAG